MRTEPPQPLVPLDVDPGLYTRHSGRVARVRLALVCMDLATIAGAHLLVLSALDTPPAPWAGGLTVSVLLSLVFLPVLLFLNGAYSLTSVRSAVRMFQALWRSVPAYFVVVLASHFFFPQLGMSPAAVALSALGAGIGVGASRALLFKLLRDARDRHSVLIIGAGWSGRTIGQILLEYLGNQVRVVGYVDDDAQKLGKEIVADCRVLGTTSDLTHLVVEYQVSELVLAITEQIPERLFTRLGACAEQGATWISMANLYEEITGRVPVKHIDDRWFLYCFAPELQRVYETLKRAVDVAAGLMGLAALASLYPFIALATWLDSGRPILYRQVRVGRGERLFTIHKFRTMVQNAEADGAAVWAAPNDSRTTRIGAWLRRTRLDELPQFWNVLKGEMSLVGPRPERPEFVSELSREIPFFNRRHAVLPGITGWAQVRYPYGASVEDSLQKLQYDLYYIKHRSLFLDAVILLKTLVTVLARDGR
ncbi:MAG: sugar transferase [Armatimonadetes bacterium]|nr:sugar transferase [Armatimonadota bacterium]